MKLVLLPGLDGTGVLFRPLLASLPPSIEPIVVSYPAREPLGYDDLLPLVDKALPRDEPHLILGESFGGPLSLRAAATRPPGLRGVILCGSFVTCPYAYAPPWLVHAVRPALFHSFPLFVKLQAALGLYESPEHHALAKEAIFQVSPAVFAHRAREIARIDVTPELRACKTPLLYIQGTRDRVVGAGNLRGIQRIRPDIQVARIDCGHMILKTRPVEAAAVIAEFVKRCG